MRVAYVCADPGVPVFGPKGCSVHAQEIIRAMLHHGAELDLFVARTGGQPPTDLQQCTVQELPIEHCAETRRREVEQISWNQRVVRALENRGVYDLVYERHSIWSAGAMSWAQDKGVPSVLEVNAPLIDEQAKHRHLVQSRRAAELTGIAMRKARMVYGVSDAIPPYCRRFLPDKRQIHVIANGVNVERFSPHVVAADAFPGLTIGFIGSLKPWHGLDLLLEAFSRYCRSLDRTTSASLGHSACRLVIVGDGPQRDTIEAWLDQHDELRARVKLVGAVSPEAVPAWLNSIDIAVAPYPNLDDFYFSPLKIFEYMAAGRVVVASGIGQIRDVMEHGVNGWLYAPGDVDRLVASLIELSGNASLRFKLSQAARRQAKQHSWQRVLDKILSACLASPVVPFHSTV